MFYINLILCIVNLYAALNWCEYRSIAYWLNITAIVLNAVVVVRALCMDTNAAASAYTQLQVY